MAAAISVSDDSSETDEEDPKVSPKQIINNYQRRRITDIFGREGSGPKSCNKIFSAYSKVDKTVLGEFLSSRAHTAQQKVKEEVSAEEFQTMDKWANFFKEHELHTKCGSELPLLLRAIAMTEPAPNSKDEIDFKKLYLWLAEVMVGNAPPDLNAQSQLFLVDNYKNLLAAANAQESVNELLEISKAVSEKIHNKDSQHDNQNETNFVNSVDPFGLSIKKEYN